MKAGDRLEEHAAPGPFSLSVREGRIRFEAAEVVGEAGPEALLTLRHRGAAHGGGLERRGVPAHHRGGSSQSRDLLASKLNFVELYGRTSENSVTPKSNFAEFTFYEVR